MPPNMTFSFPRLVAWTFMTFFVFFFFVLVVLPAVAADNPAILSLAPTSPPSVDASGFVGQVLAMISATAAAVILSLLAWAGVEVKGFVVKTFGEKSKAAQYATELAAKANDEAARAYLNDILYRSIGWGLVQLDKRFEDLKHIEVSDKVTELAAGFVLRAAPDALKRFDKNSNDIIDMIEARIPSAQLWAGGDPTAATVAPSTAPG